MTYDRLNRPKPGDLIALECCSLGSSMRRLMWNTNTVSSEAWALVVGKLCVGEAAIVLAYDPKSCCAFICNIRNEIGWLDIEMEGSAFHVKCIS